LEVLTVKRTFNTGRLVKSGFMVLLIAALTLAAFGCKPPGTSQTTSTMTSPTSGSQETTAQETSTQETSTQESTTRPVDTISQATLDRYQANEIKDYNGLRLDPSIGPRDNSIKGIQYVDINTYQLEITGLVNKPVKLSYKDIISLPSVERLNVLFCVEGWAARILWQGVQFSTLFDLAGGVDPSANTVIFNCVDTYSTSLSLQTVIEKKLILAYKSNGLTLPPELGYPFIVVAQDKFGYKWARWVNQIIISSNADYHGYWESVLGYDNVGDIVPTTTEPTIFH
jgi:DMSO/TMAO reductase YedYZ molybdopterin-dependent catalytic subunit